MKSCEITTQFANSHAIKFDIRNIAKTKWHFQNTPIHHQSQDDCKIKGKFIAKIHTCYPVREKIDSRSHLEVVNIFKVSYTSFALSPTWRAFACRYCGGFAKLANFSIFTFFGVLGGHRAQIVARWLGPGLGSEWVLWRSVVVTGVWSIFARGRAEACGDPFTMAKVGYQAGQTTRT